MSPYNYITLSKIVQPSKSGSSSRPFSIHDTFQHSLSTPIIVLLVFLSTPPVSSSPSPAPLLGPASAESHHFVIRSFHHTPSILLITIICVALIFDFCSFHTAHASHPYIKTGITVAFTTFNLVCLLSSLLPKMA